MLWVYPHIKMCHTLDCSKACYASVLVCGKEKLEDKLEEMEESIWPGVTSWCTRCQHPRLLTQHVNEFPCESAHHVHQYIFWKSMIQHGLY